MRTLFVPLFISCAALAAGCSSGSQSSTPGMLPQTTSQQSGQQSQATSSTLGSTVDTASPVATTGAEQTSAYSQTTHSMSNAVKKTLVVAAVPAYPSDFPVSAQAGTTSRFAATAADRPLPAGLAISPVGLGTSGGKSVTFMRPDGSALVAIYYPGATTVQSGSVYVKFGTNAAVPATSVFADDGTWADTSSGQRAMVMVSSYYAKPSRVALLNLNGPQNATPLPVASAAPTAAATATPTPAPTPTAVAVAPPGSNNCVHFRSNPMCTPLPATKSLAGNTAAWTSLLFQSGRGYFQHIEVTSDPSDVNNGSEPVFALNSSTPSVSNIIACDKTSWSAYVCGGLPANKTLQLPTNLVPASNSDHHASIADAIRQGEQDFWLAGAPGANGATVHVGGTGFCPWSGSGTGCSGSTATNIATSLGGIDPVDVQNAEASPNGVLPYAIGVAVLCADPTYVFPATASDGVNTNTSSACSGHTAAGQRPPEGARAFIDKSDAEINATSNKPYVKVILRTMGREHLGMTITDTNWSGAPGLAPQTSTASPAAWAFALREAGISTSGTQWLPITNIGINMVTDIKFCSNGTC